MKRRLWMAFTGRVNFTPEWGGTRRGREKK